MSRSEHNWRVATGTRVAAVALLLAGPLIAIAPPTLAAPSAPLGQVNKVLFSVPVGSQISYKGGASERETWGPAGLAVAGDNTVWLIDGAADRLLGFSMLGSPVGVIDLSTSVVGIRGLAAFGSDLVVLDASAAKPQVLVVDSSSKKTISRIELPASAGLDRGLSGVAVESDGTIIAKLEGGTTNVRVGRIATATKVAQMASPEKATTARLLLGSVRLDAQADWSKPVGIEVNGRDISIVSSGRELTADLAGSTSDRLFVKVTETSQDSSTGRLLVDSTMRVFDAQGAVVDATRVPKGTAIRGSSTAVAPDGRILALVSDREGVSVVELGMVAPEKLTEVLPSLPSPESIADSPAGVTSAESASPAATTSCVSRSTMASRDSTYRGNSHQLSTTNITGSCSGRTKPHYLGSAGTYSSVPYKWGGFDSVSDFNAKMSPGTGRAGDVSAGDTLTCAYGVDCSGFVSRVWGLKNKKGTSTLPGISPVIPENWLLPYDIFNKDGHVMMFRSKASGGYYVSEATTKDNVDRVVYQYHEASYVDDFTPRRYDSVCLECTSKDPCP